MRSHTLVPKQRFYSFCTTSGRCAALIAGLFTGSAALAQGGSLSPADKLITRGSLDWKTGTVTVAAQGPQLAAQTAQQLVANQQRHFLIQMTESVTRSQRAALQAAGVELQTYMGDNAFYAVAKGDFDPAQLANIATVRAVQPIRLEWKLASELLTGQVWDYAVARPEEALADDDERLELSERLQAQMAKVDVRPNDWVAANVLIHPDITFPEAVQLVDFHGGIVRSRFVGLSGMTVEIPYTGLLGLMAEDAIQYAEPPIPGFSELNAQNRANTGVDVVQAPPYSINGTGVTVMVFDGGTVRATHQDFNGRAINGDTDAVSSHATHVSGTIGGSGTVTFANRGMAPGVNLVCYGFEVPGGLSQGFLYTQPGDLEADYGNAINTRGAHITNNSIGTNLAQNGYPCDWTGNYNITDQIIDAIVRGSVSNGAPHRIVWANGNERGSGRCLGIEGWASPFHSTAPPACAKNHITVGATLENATGPATFTSYGPSDDGRLKPDVSAPGVSVLSTTSSSDTAYASLSGTSMASPTVCGISALILSDFRVQYPAEPDFRNSTLKVLLAHSARDQIGPEDNRGPDYKFGYGLVNAQFAIDLMRSGNFFEASLDQGETKQFFVLVPADANELKVTLAWDDAPAAVLPANALVNDLDLRVFDTNGTQYFPWTLATTNAAGPGNPAVRTQPDHKNNIEQVVIDSPPPGVYRVEIHGFNVPQGPQPYSVTATPVLINCSSQGVISLSGSQFQCTDTLAVQVVDCDLNTDDGTTQTVDVNVASTSVPGGITVTLTESDPASATFIGSISLGAVGDLAVMHGDTVTATYDDADTGSGSPGTATVNGTIDCVAPQITSVTFNNVTPTSADVTIVTDEPTRATVRFGTSCGNLTEQVASAALTTNRTISLVLNNQPVYYVVVDATDGAGNSITDDNGGSCYPLAQPVLALPFQDDFNGANVDMNKWSVNMGVTQDSAGANEPSPPNSARLTGASGTTNDDHIISHFVDLSAFGTARLSYWYHKPSTNAPEANDDLVFSYLNTSGQWVEISRQLGSQPVMTNYQQVEVNLPPAAIHAGFKLKIEIAASATSDEWFVDDVRIYTPEAPDASDVTVETIINGSVDVTLSAVDPQHDPLTYTIVSLPANGSLVDPNMGPITGVPHTVLLAGNVVQFIPNPGFFGNDAFNYQASDGTHESNIATATILIEPGVRTDLFFDPFPTTTFDSAIWAQAINATIDGVGIAEPSEPNSARLNGNPVGNGDSFTSHPFDTTGYNEVRLAYWYQRRGGGESPEANEDLIVEYMNASSQWVELDRQLGSGADMNTYEKRVVTLPAGALHPAAQIRFRSMSTVGAFDDWFVDDVHLYGYTPPPTGLAGDMNCDGTISVSDISGFVLALTDPAGYAAQFPDCNIDNADLNNDGSVSVGDIGAFVALLTGG